MTDELNKIQPKIRNNNVSNMHPLTLEPVSLNTPIKTSKDVRTFIVSVPGGSQSPKINKLGKIKELKEEDSLFDLSKDIKQIEQDVTNIVNNIQEINVNCTNCCLHITKLCSDCRLKNEISASATSKVKVQPNVDVKDVHIVT